VYACRASKAALNIINKALVMDLKEQQVECVLMHPGYVQTDMTSEGYCRR
jgi:short-subunit dehydrogenase